MRFYQQQHQYYCRVDLHARSMYLHILDADKRTVLDEDLPAEPGAASRRTRSLADPDCRDSNHPGATEVS